MKTENFLHANPATKLVITRTRHASETFSGTKETVKELYAGESFEIEYTDSELIESEEVTLPIENDLTTNDLNNIPEDSGSINDAVTTSSDAGGLVDKALDAIGSIFKKDGDPE